MVQKDLATRMATTSTPGDAFVGLVGHFGRWQLLIFASLFLVKLSSGWVQLAILFLTPKVVFWCVSGNVSDVVNSTCYESCEEYAFDASPFERTIVSEWGLVCERRWLASFTQTVLQLGILIGSIVFGFLADRYGRKNTFLLATALLIAAGFGVPFSPEYATFTGLRFVQGFATAGTMVISFVLIMETVGPKWRELLGCLYHIPFILGHLTVPLFAYYFRTWSTYTLALAVPPLMYLGYFFLVTESPRWLVSVGRVDEAVAIVEKAARMNNLPISTITETLTNLSKEKHQSAALQTRFNYLDLVRTRQLRRRTLGCGGMWLVSGLTFFGFNQYISQTSPDPFVSVAAAAAIQIPSNFLAVWLIKRCGRRGATSGAFCLGGVVIITLCCLREPSFWVSLTLGTLGVSCAAIFSAAIYIFSSELFPTVARNMGIGVCSMSMRVGSMIAPFVANLSHSVPWLATVVFGVAPFLAGLVCLCLPETAGRDMPDSVEDVEGK